MAAGDFLTLDEFNARLRSEGPWALVDSYLLRGLPYAFRESPALYGVLRRELASSLGLPKSSFVVVGSGRTGFSLRTDAFGYPFGEGSDIDVSVISARLFDGLWFDLLRVSRARAAGFGGQRREHFEEHRRTRIYNGRAVPHQLVGATQLAGRWFKAFKGVGRRVPDLAQYEVHGMLFRTWEHARLYYAYGLRRVLAGQQDEGT